MLENHRIVRENPWIMEGIFRPSNFRTFSPITHSKKNRCSTKPSKIVLQNVQGLAGKRRKGKHRKGIMIFMSFLMGSFW